MPRKKVEGTDSVTPKNQRDDGLFEYCLRVNKIDGFNFVALFSWLETYCDRVIGCYEYVHDNHHYHFWIIAKQKYETITTAFNRTFPELKGNEHKAWKCDNGNLKYICKGPLAISKLKDPGYPGEKRPPEIVINTMNLPQLDIDAAHEEWWSEAMVWKSNKKSKESVCQVVEALFIEKMLNPHIERQKDEAIKVGLSLMEILRFVHRNYGTMTRYKEEHIECLWRHLVMKYREHIVNADRWILDFEYRMATRLGIHFYD